MAYGCQMGWLLIVSVNLFVTESKKELDIKAKEMTAGNSTSENEKVKGREMETANDHSSVDAELNSKML